MLCRQILSCPSGADECAIGVAVAGWTDTTRAVLCGRRGAVAAVGGSRTLCAVAYDHRVQCDADDCICLQCVTVFLVCLSPCRSLATSTSPFRPHILFVHRQFWRRSPPMASSRLLFVPSSARSVAVCLFECYRFFGNCKLFYWLGFILAAVHLSRW
jgi:hypothetical protein